MVENVGQIKNPLTIIAIFAAIAEISGTVVLPFIATENQAIYVWFLIIFPILLIAFFFLTLNFNHKVLYAPSDYKNEDNFLHSLPRATYAEKVLKIEAELAEAENAPVLQKQPDPAPMAPISHQEVEPSTTYQQLLRRSPQAMYMLAEELIFKKLSKEFSSEIQREVMLGSSAERYILDGIVRDKEITTVIEVKFFRRALSNIHIRHIIRNLEGGVKFLPPEQTKNLRLLLAIASDGDDFDKDLAMRQIERYRNDFSFPIEVRFYNLADLEREAQIKA